MKIKKNIFVFIIIGVIIGYFGGVAIFYFTKEPPSFLDAFLADYAFVGIAVGFVLALGIFWLINPKKVDSRPNAKSTGKTSDGQEMDLSFNAKWLKPEDIPKQFGLIATTWNQLPQLKNTGIVFRNVMENGKYQIAMKDEYHCLIIGTTGSGKTSICLIPTIRILAHTAEKPCMVVSDPKGELYQKTSRIMQDEGYRVITLDLRDPFSSTRWNPMEHAFDMYHKGKNCKNNIKKCTNGAKPKEFGFKEIPGAKYGKEWFGFEGIAYPTEDELRVAVNSAEQVYCAQAQNELKEICNTIAPKSKNATDPTWEEGAQDYLYGCGQS